jgi:hypothetical protein
LAFLAFLNFFLYSVDRRAAPPRGKADFHSFSISQAFPKITATDCDTVRPAVAPKAFGAMARQARLADGWQKDEPGRKMESAEPRKLSGLPSQFGAT